MVSKSKLYAQLDSLEIELEERLIPLLKQAASGKNDLIFCVNDFNSYPELASKTNKNTEACINLGSQILTLKNKLEESSEGSVAERICWYCRQWGNKDNHHRDNTQELAKQFLLEIEQSKS